MVHDPRVTAQLSRLGGVYRDPARVDRDASTLLRSALGSHLRPISAEMVENNGRTSVVLVLQGTIAIDFKGQTFQQLVDVYLPTVYPRGPPVCFVRLADNMYLKENHAHVGSDGQVYLPILHEWNPAKHDLMELVVAMSSVFSNEPPVFTRASAAEPPPPPPPPPSVAAAAAASHPPPPPPAYSEQNLPSWRRDAEAILAAEAAEANAAAEAARQAQAQAEQDRKAQQERVLAAQRQQKAQREQQQQQREWEQARCNSIRDQVALKLQQHLQKSAAATQQQVQSDARDQHGLERTKEQKIDLQLEWYQSKQKELQRLVDVAAESCQGLEAWLEQQEQEKKNEQKALTIDEQVQPATALHEQMLDLSAENAVISDLLYFLDRGLDRGILQCDQHLKQVRRLAKRQFLVRAHLIKINQVLLATSSNSV